MASTSAAWLYQDKGLRCTVSADGFIARNPCLKLQTSFLSSQTFQVRIGLTGSLKRVPALSSIKCERKDENSKKDENYKKVSVERPPYYSYLDSTSGELEPASGARASIPEQDYWPEGTASRVRAANAPEPTGQSVGSPSFGKSPGSRRKKHLTSVAAHETSEVIVESSDLAESESSDDSMDDPKEKSEFVEYQNEPDKEEKTGYELDKKLGRPHAFIDPRVKKPIGESLTSEELWWNWRKPDKEQWSRWQRRRPDVETVFLKAMAETGQVKLYGDHPTLTETALFRARRHLFKEERLQDERERLSRDGPLSYYSEWVKAWKKDTSREAIQKHYEETGEDEIAQLIDMFCHQTDREYRIMMGTDIRIPRDPLAMRMREDQIKQIWGGDPVYPTVNYIQEPDKVIDYRGPDFHEPTPNMLDFLKEHGKIISREELEKLLAKDKTEEVQVPEIEEAMAQAVDIGENEDESEDSEAEEVEVEVVDDGKIKRNWSISKTTPGKSKGKTKTKPKKNGGGMSLDEAVEDSENLTDFLLDFEEEE